MMRVLFAGLLIGAGMYVLAACFLWLRAEVAIRRWVLEDDDSTRVWDSWADMMATSVEVWPGPDEEEQPVGVVRSDN